MTSSGSSAVPTPLWQNVLCTRPGTCRPGGFPPIPTPPNLRLSRLWLAGAWPRVAPPPMHNQNHPPRQPAKPASLFSTIPPSARAFQYVDHAQLKLYLIRYYYPFAVWARKSPQPRPVPRNLHPYPLEHWGLQNCIKTFMHKHRKLTLQNLPACTCETR